MNNMNVIIADDHPIVLFGIRKITLEQIEWVNVVGEFEDSTALINNHQETGCACVDYRSLHAAISTAMALP